MTTEYRELRARRDSEMTASEREAYEAAYETAGVAFRVAELFFDARSTAGLTQVELAHRMHTTQPAIAEIEGGARVPTLDMLERLAHAVGRRLELNLSA